jgi:hypothetical protein
MKTILTLLVAAVLLSLSTISMAATVTYQNPDLTIVAKDEPLDAVLKSLGKEMQIYVTVPTGLNPVVNCDIQQQPVKQAFKTLLGDMSYSLQWSKKTGKLLGLTILAGGTGNAGVASVSDKGFQSQSGEQAAPAATTSVRHQGAVVQGKHDTSTVSGETAVAEDVAIAEHKARMEVERANQEARMEIQRVEHLARMAEEREAILAEAALRRQEDEQNEQNDMADEKSR